MTCESVYLCLAHRKGYEKIFIMRFSCLRDIIHAFVSVCNAASGSFSLAKEHLFFIYQPKCSVWKTFPSFHIRSELPVIHSPSILYVLGSAYRNNETNCSFFSLLCLRPSLLLPEGRKPVHPAYHFVALLLSHPQHMSNSQ